MLNKLEKILAPLAERLANNIVLTAIRDGFLVTTPLLIVASIFLVIANFPIPGYSEFMAGFLGTGWEAYLDPIINSTFGVIALIGSVGIGYSYGKLLEVDPIASAAVSLASFLILSPQTHPDFVGPEQEVFNGFAFSNLGTAGLFLAMITALLSVKLFAYASKKGWVITLPDGVPPAVMNSFAALIPSGMVLLLALLVNILFSFTPYKYAHNFIYEILQSPLMGFGQSFIFEPIYQFLSTLFWFFGINGPAVTNTTFSPIHLALTTENLTAFNAGEPLPNIFTQPFGDFFANFGGGGSTLSLVILMVFVAKSQRMKQLGKLSLIPGVFGINEMVIFGLPVVLNPIIFIPFIICPLVNIIISTIATQIGVIPYTTGASLPWTTPPFFSGWLSTGSMLAGLLQIGLIVLDCVIYYPFFKVMDKQYLQDEQTVEEQEDDLDSIDLGSVTFD
ncbi:PTS sugar transporter subunit IIC [Facklamia lactis]|uniref:PTS sugar transporter subunit IIC n=1 Tax=Facklamia lactis TaxID=2749967 RepID=UPI0018CD0926|nr:PTS transporter subunit EIIC [Facklamia lactis]MBG9979456.1 PTS sugar transporter subunit IIC [Facklamia lactis]